MAGELEAGTSMSKVVIAVVVIAIVSVAGVIIVLNTDPGEAGQEITILTRHDVAIHEAYETAFLQTDYAIQNNIINIQWKTQAPNFWDEVINAGGIDILWGGGPTLFDQMNREGYLLPLDSALMQEALGRVPDEIAGTEMKRTDGGDVVWVAAAISTFGFTINQVFLDQYSLPTPNNWTHLAQPIWGSLLPTETIAMGNAPKTTSNTRIYEIITQGMGWDTGWVTMARMAGSARIFQGSVETQAAAENGEVGVSMSIDFYGYNTQANNPDCRYILPEGESIVNGDPIALCSTTAKQDLAEGFIDWVLTGEGQAVWFTPGVRRMPVLESAFSSTTDNVTSLYAFYNMTLENEGIDFDDTLSVEINTAFISYFEAVFNNPHETLQDTWGALVAAYYAEEISLGELNTLATQMGTPVTVDVDGVDEKFTVELAQEINEDMIYDTDFYAAMQTKWSAAAIAQYNAVLDALALLLM